jgi:hypothetical protein
MARLEMLGSALEMSVAQRKVKKQIYELGRCNVCPLDGACFASGELDGDVLIEETITINRRAIDFGICSGSVYH